MDDNNKKGGEAQVPTKKFQKQQGLVTKGSSMKRIKRNQVINAKDNSNTGLTQST